MRSESLLQPKENQGDIFVTVFFCLACPTGYPSHTSSAIAWHSASLCLTKKTLKVNSFSEGH